MISAGLSFAVEVASSQPLYAASEAVDYTPDGAAIVLSKAVTSSVVFIALCFTPQIIVTTPPQAPVKFAFAFLHTLLVALERLHSQKGGRAHLAPKHLPIRQGAMLISVSW